MGDETALDPRRRIPRTDALLADPVLSAAARTLGLDLVKRVVSSAQQRARTGQVPADAVLADAIAHLPASAASMTPVLNATGIVVHTNLGRAPLSPAAVDALVRASGTVDVELDLATGRRGRRGGSVLDALTEITGAEDALVVNNGAAAVLLATTALRPAMVSDRAPEVVISRGELVEIGDGFRIPDLIASTGVRLVEVGTTNRTHLADYRAAITAATACVLKVHTSNFRVDGFTAQADIVELATLGVPVVVDIGSGLLRPDADLPDEPDAASALAAGADLVTCSGDKLLGGPQAGIIVGRRDPVHRLRRHPMARALRVDKLTLAALEATLRGPEPPVTRHRRRRRDDVEARTRALADAVGGEVVESVGHIGGGGAPGVDLPGLAVALPEPVAEALRTGSPAVLARVDRARTLVDLRCIEPSDDAALREAIMKALAACG